ncbi:MAG: hypothetical protein QX199_10595 [Methylococcaceae bacterium]
MNKNDCVNKLSEDELELKHFIDKGNKLKWTWVIGTLLIIICISYGDAAQWLLAVIAAFYIFITTVNYFKSVS